MHFGDLNFIQTVHTLLVGDEAVDVVKLADGRLLVIDGDSVTLFEDLDQVLDADDEDADGERPTISL